MEDPNKIELTDEELSELLSVLADTPTLMPEDTQKAVARLREAAQAKAIAESMRPRPGFIRFGMPGADTNKKTG